MLQVTELSVGSSWCDGTFLELEVGCGQAEILMKTKLLNSHMRSYILSRNILHILPLNFASHSSRNKKWRRIIEILEFQ